MSILHHLVWALVNSIWQSAALAALVFFAMRCFRRSTAAQRYAIWSAVLFACALLPGFDFALSEGWVSARAGNPVVALVIPYRGDSATVASPLQRDLTANANLSASAQRLLAIPNAQAVPESAARASRPQQYPGKLARVTDFFAALFAGRYDASMLLLWFFAANLLIARLAIGYQGLRLVKQGLLYRELTGREWEDFYGMTSRPVAIGYSSAVTEPCVIGFARPAIALPIGIAEKLSPDDAIRILRHECAHISRWDDYGNLFKQAISALIFFNPAVYFVSRALDVDREIACDDAVALAEADRVDFAKCLYEIASSSSSRKWVPVTGLIRGKRQIVVRIKQLLDANHSGSTRLSAFAKLGALAVVASAVPFAYVQITASAASSQPAWVAVPSPLAYRETGKTLTVAARVAPRLARQPATRHAATVPARFEPPSVASRRQIPSVQQVSPTRADAGLAEAAAMVARSHVKIKSAVAPPVLMPAELVRVKVIQVQHAIAAQRVAMLASGQTAMTQVWFSLRRVHVPTATAMDTERDDFLQAIHDAGFRGLSVDDLIAIRDAEVSAKFLQELHAAGLTPMPAAELVELSNAGVDAAFLGRICKTVYANLKVRDLIELSNAGVRPDFLNTLAGLGYHLSVKDVISLANNGVDQRYIAAFARVGYQTLSADDLMQLSDNGVDAAYVATLAKLGYQRLSVRDLIRLSNNGVTADFIAHLNASGVDASHQISVDDLIKLHDAGI